MFSLHSVELPLPFVRSRPTHPASGNLLQVYQTQTVSQAIRLASLAVYFVFPPLDIGEVYRGVCQPVFSWTDNVSSDSIIPCRLPLVFATLTSREGWTLSTEPNGRPGMP